MIKNSTVIIAAAIIMIGVVVNGIVSNVFERKNLTDKNKIDLEIKKLEVHKQILDVEPLLLKTSDLDLVYMPNVNFKNNAVNVNYTFYTPKNDVLVKVPIH